MHQIKRFSTILSLILATFISGSVLAQGNSGNASGQNRNLGHNNASDGVMGRIVANRQIFYSGDPLDIGVRFPRGAELVSDGEVDVWLVIFAPDATMLALPINDEVSPTRRNLFTVDSVDVGALPEGVYQLGLVLTIPDGDPLQITDWYNGMLGLVDVRGLTISAEPLEIDDDGDGTVDDDMDDDGFVDDDLDDDTDTSDTSDTGGTSTTGTAS